MSKIVLQLLSLFFLISGDAGHDRGSRGMSEVQSEGNGVKGDGREVSSGTQRKRPTGGGDQVVKGTGHRGEG